LARNALRERETITLGVAECGQQADVQQDETAILGQEWFLVVPRFMANVSASTG